MNRYTIRQFFMVIALVMLLAGGLGTSPVAAQGGETVVISNPQTGETVSGVITITGTVDFSDFQKFEVFLSSGGNMIWIATIFSPVVNGNLARLDTKTVADGGYQIVIRTVHADSNYNDHPGPSFTIKNDLGAPQPFSEVISSFLYPSPNGAVARVQNCTGYNLFFDYTSPQGFCSAGEIVVPPKLEGNDICPSTDIFLTACEYRGTAFVEEPGGTPYNYSLVAESGKLYEIIHPGGARLYINQIKGDELVTLVAATETSEAAAGTELKGPGASSEAAAPAVANSGAVVAPPPVKAEILPESGQGAAASKLPFVLAGGVLILFMVVGGFVALQRGKQAV